jgi:hypothetical protein
MLSFTMKIIKAVFFLAFVLATTSIAETAEERDLLLDGEMCADMADGMFSSGVVCECDIAPARGQVGLFCYTDNLCSPEGTVCGTIAWYGSFTLIPTGDFLTEICVQDILWSNTTFPVTEEPDDFCVSYSLSLVDIIISVVEIVCPDGIAACVSAVSAASTPNEIEGCEMRVKNEVCNSCTPCNSVGGVTFDCSNVANGFTKTACTDFNPILGLGYPVKVAIPDL